MFKQNKRHLETSLFAPEMFLDEKIKHKLEETKENYFYKIIFTNIKEKIFEPLYSDEGSPNAPINILVSAILLKEKKGWSYEELFNHMMFDLLTRAALGLSYLNMGELPFVPATIFNFLNRLKEYENETGINLIEKVFDELTLEQIKKLKIKTDIQRADSFLITSNIRKYGRLELLIEVIRRLYRILSKKDKRELKEQFEAYIKEDSSNNYIYKLKSSDIPKELEKIGQIYYFLYYQLKNKYEKKEIFKIFERVFHEHFETGKKQLVIKEIHSGVLQSPDDLDATYRKKGKQESKGSVVDVVETCNPENEFQLLTDIAVEANNINDNNVLNPRIDKITQKTDLKELHTDGAYGSKKNDKKFEEKGVNHVQTAICGEKAEVKIIIEQVSAESYRVSCPFQSVMSKKTRKKYKACFTYDICGNCQVKKECSTSPHKKNRTYYFTHEDCLKTKRFEAVKKLPPERRKLRANIEATVKEFKTPTKNGKLKVRGRFKTKIFAFSMGITINFGRIYRYIREKNNENPNFLKEFAVI